FTNTSYGIQQGGATLNIFSSSILSLTSATQTNLVTPMTSISGNMTLNGTVTNTLKVANGIQFECNPGPVHATIGFQSNCSCLRVESHNGVCMVANGTMGIQMTASSGGVNIVNSPLAFINGSYI